MMHPEIQQVMVDEHIAALRQDARRPVRPPAVVANEYSRIELRLCSVHDLDALEELAALNETALPEGSFVVAIVDGRLVAAQPIEGGPLLADPFVRTLHLRNLLELRAMQLRPAPRWSLHLPRAVRRAIA